MSTELLIDVPYGQQKPPYGTQLNKSWVQKYNPSLVLPFNESAGNIVYDISGNQNNGVFNNGPIWQQSNNGSAIFLNGQTVNPQQISVPNSPTLNPSSVTVSVWFCTTNGGPLVHNVILAKTYKFFNLIYQYEIEMNNSGRIAASIRNSSNGVVTSLTTGVNNYSDGRWHNAIISYSSIANTLFLMIDGIVLASSSGFTSVMATDGLFPLIIGNSGQSTQSSGNGPFSGMVANVVILPYSLTIQQAQKLYYNPYGMYFKPALKRGFYYTLNFPINLTSKVLSGSHSSAQKTIARVLATRNLSTSNLFTTKSIKQNINSQVNSQTDSQVEEHVQRKLNSQAISQTENQSQEHVQRKLSSQVIVNSGFVKSSFNLLLVFASKVLSISYSLAKLTFSGRKFQLLSFRRTSQQAINQGEATPEDSGQ